MGHSVHHKTMSVSFTGISDNTDVLFSGNHSPTLTASSGQKALQTTVCMPPLTTLAQTSSTMSTSDSRPNFTT